MKARKILSALLAAAVMTSTAAYAEEVSTEEKTILTTINEKGTVTLSEDATTALVNAIIEYNGYSEDTEMWGYDEMTVIDENTTLSISDCNVFDKDAVTGVNFYTRHFTENEDGSLKIEGLAGFSGRIALTELWKFSPNQYNPHKQMLSDTIEVSEIKDVALEYFCEFLYMPELSDTKRQLFLNGWESVDMLEVRFYIPTEAVDENGEQLYRWFGADFLTENGAAKLGNFSASSGNDVVSAPAAEFEAAEAISADDFAELLSANAEADVTVKTENGVSFTFAKGEMTAVDGVESYDFSSVINTTYDAEKNSAIAEEDFVLSIDYSYSGKLPAKAHITIPVGKDYAGKTLYYSQILESGVKLISSAVVDENGNITVVQDHCSEYVLSTTNPESSAVVDTDAAVDTGKDAVDTGVEGIAAVAGIVLAAGAVTVLSRKKR